MPKIEQRSDGTYSVEFDPPGPFLVLTRRQLAGLGLAMHNAGLITLDRLSTTRPG
jgi:hypothetical protein